MNKKEKAAEKAFAIFIVFAILFSIVFCIAAGIVGEKEDWEKLGTEPSATQEIVPEKDEEKMETEVEVKVIKNEAPLPEPTYYPQQDEVLPQDDVELLALVTIAEAEGECEEGKRLVIDTVLNRVDSTYFPNTIYDVIYQANQFSSMWNGRADRCVVTDEVRQLVEEEMQSRYNTEVMFFNAGHYSTYGTPMFQLGGHYFSSYD
jgi:N-acetylmuramoyl-L-alanine amidase